MPRPLSMHADRAVGVDRDRRSCRRSPPWPRRSRCRRPRTRGGAGRGRWWCRCTCPAACGPARGPRGPGCCWSRSRRSSSSWLLIAPPIATILRSAPDARPRAACGGPCAGKVARTAVHSTQSGTTGRPGFGVPKSAPSTCGFARLTRIRSDDPVCRPRASSALQPDLLVEELRLGSPRPVGRLHGQDAALERRRRGLGGEPFADDLRPLRRELAPTGMPAAKTSSRMQAVDDLADATDVAGARVPSRPPIPSRAASQAAPCGRHGAGVHVPHGVRRAGTSASSATEMTTWPPRAGEVLPDLVAPARDRAR